MAKKSSTKGLRTLKGTPPAGGPRIDRVMIPALPKGVKNPLSTDPVEALRQSREGKK